MHNFKAGDEAILVSVEPQWAVPAGTKVKIQRACNGRAGPGYFVELSTKPGSNIYYAEHRLGPVDDPLPPAPESVRYATMQYEWQGEYNDQCLTVGPHTSEKGAVSIRIQGNSKSTRNKDMSLCVILTSGEVLQLAHDLNRMANEIKRKEKNND